MRQLILVGETGSRDCLEPGQEGFVGLVVFGNGSERVVRQLVVVTIVAEGGRALRKVAEIGLVLLVENRILGGDAVGNRLYILRESTTDYGRYKKEDWVKAHKYAGYQSDESLKTRRRVSPMAGHSTINAN